MTNNYSTLNSSKRIFLLVCHPWLLDIYSVRELMSSNNPWHINEANLTERFSHKKKENQLNKHRQLEKYEEAKALWIHTFFPKLLQKKNEMSAPRLYLWCQELLGNKLLDESQQLEPCTTHEMKKSSCSNFNLWYTRITKPEADHESMSADVPKTFRKEKQPGGGV